MLLHRPDGTVLECTIANVFAVFDGVLVTPPATLPLLAGIARGRVLAAAKDAGIPVREEAFPLSRLASAEACFATNALLIAHPVREIAGIAAFDSEAWALRLREGVRSKGV